jgi:pimeloyl-CoA synthetase
MKAKKITYSRLISKANFENIKIEIEIEIEENEKASEVFNAAKEWVENRLQSEKLSESIINKAYEVLSDQRNHTLAQIEEAKTIIERFKVNDNLPF